MRRAYELPLAIQWHEGMLLAPQHFQQQALRFDELLHYHALAVSPFHWGVRELQIDENLLLGGVLRVLELEAVMPDGTVVHHRHGENELELDLSEHADDITESEMLVQLLLPVSKPGSTAVRGDLARYRSVPGPAVSDENTGEGDVVIPRLEPKLSLMLWQVLGPAFSTA